METMIGSSSGARTGRPVLLAALGAGAALVGVELMVTAVALPGIVVDLADWTQLRHASWIVNGYLLAYICAMPLGGRLGDRFGIAAPFGLSLILFAAGSALAGAAQDLDQLIAARVVQGLGGGGVVPLATAGASELFAGAARARALGLVGALTFLGMAAGPFIGAAVLESFDLSNALAAGGLGAGGASDLLVPPWRWTFYVSAPFALLAALVAWAAAPGWERPRRRAAFDLTGAFLVTLALAALLLALTAVGADPDEALPDPLPPAIVAATATVLAFVRLRTAREPFLDASLLRRLPIAGAVILSLLTGYALATAIIGGAVFVDRVRYGGPAEQRLALGGLAAATALGALASGFVLRRFGAVQVTLLGLAIGGCGLLGLSLVATGGSADLPALALALFGLGFGLTVTARSTVAVEAAGRRAFGAASAAVTVARMVGMAVGLAVLTAFGSDRIEALSLVLTDQAARDAVLPAELRGRPLQDGLVIDVLERWAAGQAASILAGLFLVAAGIMALAVLPALAMARQEGAGSADAQEVSGDDDDVGPAVAL
ncbi:MAG TPA: MFS transporter [Candidatus Limnocylindrales bacterium]|nr:MFS transporter [Candidatus Limnocylindrales bacterium]